MKEKEEVKENKCNNFYISDSIGRAMMVQQFWRSRKSRSTVLCIKFGIVNIHVTNTYDNINIIVINFSNTMKTKSNHNYWSI